MPHFSKKANFLKDFEVVAKINTVKAYIHSCLDEEDSFEDEINDCIEDKRHSQVFAYMI